MIFRYLQLSGYKIPLVFLRVQLVLPDLSGACDGQALASRPRAPGDL